LVIIVLEKFEVL